MTRFLTVILATVVAVVLAITPAGLCWDEYMEDAYQTVERLSNERYEAIERAEQRRQRNSLPYYIPSSDGEREVTIYSTPDGRTGYAIKNPTFGDQMMINVWNDN